MFISVAQLSSQTIMRLIGEGMQVFQCSEHEMTVCRGIHENEGIFTEENDLVTREQIVLMPLPKSRSSFFRIPLENGTARYDDISAN